MTSMAETIRYILNTKHNFITFDIAFSHLYRVKDWHPIHNMKSGKFTRLSYFTPTIETQYGSMDFTYSNYNYTMNLSHNKE